MLKPFSGGFAAWYDPFSASTWRIVDVNRTVCFLVLVISFTLRLEIFLSSFEALTELGEILEALGSRVKKLDDEFFLPFLWE